MERNRPNPPTPEQVRTLRRFDLRPLPTRGDTHLLIELVLNGSPGAKGSVAHQRAAYFESLSRVWTQRIVRRTTGDDAGTVQYLVPEDPIERAKNRADGVILKHPIRARIAWHNGIAETVPLDELVDYYK